MIMLDEIHKFSVVVDSYNSDLTLLEKLAQFSMSYSGGNLTDLDLDPLTGALNDRTAFHADTQTSMCSTAQGNPLVELLLFDK